jgi:branched-chain amino acid transport system substrate-binding protein
MPLVSNCWRHVMAMALLLPALASMPARADDPGISPQEILIGMSAPFSGASRNLGRELYRGAMACFLAVNATGGIHGRQIKLVAYDDGYQPESTFKNTLKLLQDDHVFLLFNYVGTVPVTRVLPILKKFQNDKALLFFPLTGAEPQRRPPYDALVFNLRASYRQETAGLVDHLVAAGRSRIAVFYQADAYGRGGWAGVREALAGHQLRIAAEATYARGTPHTASFVRPVEILAAEHPEAIISIGSYAASAGFIRAARQAGITVPIANISFADSDSILRLLETSGAQDDRDYTQQLIHSEVVPGINSLDLPAVREYRARMDRYQPTLPLARSAAGDPDATPSTVGFEGYLNAQLLVQILTRLGDNPRRADLPTAALNASGVDLGGGFTVSFAGGRNQGSDAVYYSTVRGGQVVPIDDWTPFTKNGSRSP